MIKYLATAAVGLGLLAGPAVALPPALSDVNEIGRIYPDLVLRGYQQPDLSYEKIRKMARTRWMAQHPCHPETIDRQRDLGLEPSCWSLADQALTQVGVWYSWGGSSPAGFDCSGLVYWSAQQLGHSVPRTTYGLMSYGQDVGTDPANWLPGDLVFPHTGHVEIYVGEGKVVEARQTGTQVQVSPVGEAMTVRRVI